MIGNDIIDIVETKRTSNYLRPRFLEKIFTENEQHSIKNSENEFLSVWELWSMKEAAYKLYIQQNPSRFYAPKKFECLINNSEKKVAYKSFECFISTQTTTNYILSEAQSIQHKIKSEVVEFKTKDLKKQSQFLKQKLLESISKKYNISSSDLLFQKSKNNIPTISYNSEIVNVSLTHHGKFGAFVYNKDMITTH